MNDNEIVELFFQRNPDGIQAAQEKYGSYCLAVARNILGGEEDSQECLNDLWLRAWNAIPPQRPKLLKAWLGKVIRNLAINCREKAAAQKRQGDQYLSASWTNAFRTPGPQRSGPTSGNSAGL